MQSLCVRLSPPRRLRAVGGLLHAAALAAVWVYGAGMWRWILLVALAVSAVWFYRRQTGSGIHAIHIDTQGRAALERADGAVCAVSLRSGSLVTPYLLLLHWQDGAGVYYQAVTPDMTDADAWRRLTVWARWMQPVEDPP